MGEIHQFRRKRLFSTRRAAGPVARGVRRKPAQIQPRPPLPRFVSWLVAALCLGAVTHAVLQPSLALPNLSLPGGTLQFDRSFSICGKAVRIDCVVDGDTIYLGGEKIRISDINTPEISGAACARERELANRAKHRLVQLLNAGPAELRRTEARDEDVYGRKLRSIYRDDRSLGDDLIAEGLAHRWQGHKQSWCG